MRLQADPGWVGTGGICVEIYISERYVAQTAGPTEGKVEKVVSVSGTVILVMLRDLKKDLQSIYNT